MSPTDLPPSDQPVDLADLPPLETKARRRITPGRVVLGVVVAASFSVWAYGFSGLAARTAPDTLANASFPAAADPACSAANETVAQMPNALDAEDNVDRAGQIVDTTAVYRQLVDDLEVLVDDPTVTLDERDRSITLEWLVDWDRFLDDRIDFAERLAQDPNAVFYVAASSGGERLERRITRFATTNEMLECVTPSDVG
jgi:hypothetical protein